MFDTLFFLQLLKSIIWILGFAASTTYFVPKGIRLCLDWKNGKGEEYLGTSIAFLAGGIFLLIYLLTVFVSAN